jgi:nucleotide-binding universal stress UspA family protein
MYEHIIVPVDGSEPSQRALCEAVELGRVHKARLTLLHVVDDYLLAAEVSAMVSFQEIHESLCQHGREVLDKAKKVADKAGVQVDTVLSQDMQGRVSDVILAQVARTGDCDLIVMGTHGRRGMNKLLMGSEAEMVVRSSPVPVMLLGVHGRRTG